MAFPVARLGHVESVGEERRILGAEHCPDLVGGPDVGGAFFTVRVGILAGGECAAGHGHLADEVVEGRLDDLAVAPFTGDLPGMQVGTCELGVVVEHLLEVRHQPGGVRGVSGETTGELIVDAARRHRIQRPARHRDGLHVSGAYEAPEQVLDRHRSRELRRPAPATVGSIKGCGQCRRCAVEKAGVDDGPDHRSGDAQERATIQADQAADRRHRRGTGAPDHGVSSGHRAARDPDQATVPSPRWCLGGCRRRARRLRHPCRLVAKRLRQPGGGRFDLLPLVPPGRRQRGEDLAEGRHAVAWFVGKVRATVERLAIRGQEDAHRPAPATGHRLHGVHVHGVEVGTLLPIYLDGHEVGVEVGGRGLVLERLALHDVAPMAGRIADGEEDRLRLGACAAERLLAPGIPVDRVVGVLKEVRAGLTGEMVGGPGDGVGRHAQRWYALPLDPAFGYAPAIRPTTRPSFSLLPWPQAIDWPAYAAVAQRTEALGFDVLWTWDHLYAIFGDHHQSIFEGYTTLAAWAAQTERIGLGLMVGANTFRNPGLVAKSIITIDHISNGRAICGMGGAWFEPEHTAHGIDFGSGFGERLDWLDESAGILRGLFDGEAVTHDGPHYQTVDLVARPRPVQAHLPIMIGGSGEKKTLRTLARYGDQWNAFGTPEVLAHKKAVLEAHCADVGRDPATIHKTVGCKIVVRDSEAEARRDWLGLLAANEMTLEEGERDTSWWFGSPEALAERMSAYRALGFDGFMVEEPAPFDPETLERLMREVAPAVA